MNARHRVKEHASLVLVGIRLLAGVALLTLPATAHCAEAAAAVAAEPPHAASATTSVPASSTTECTPATREIELAGGLFNVHRIPEGLAWDARYIVSVDAMHQASPSSSNDTVNTANTASSQQQLGVIRFALPLPPGETLHSSPGVTALLQVDDASSKQSIPAMRIMGLCVSQEALHDRTISVSFIQPTTKTDREDTLGVPLASGGVLQIIESGRRDEPRLEIALGTTFERHVGYVAPRNVSHSAREEARRLTDTQVHLTSSPIYVRGDDVRAIGGLSGRIVDPHALAKNSALGIALVFAAVVGALVFAARKLQHAAKVERADALLASEIDDAAGAAAIRRRIKTAGQPSRGAG